MGSVSINHARPEVPGGDITVSRTTGQQSIAPVEAAHSSVVTLKTAYFFLFSDIENFDLSVAVSERDFVLVAEGDGADVVVDLACLIYSVDVGGAS
jgi:hypothetical protein